MGGEGHMPTAMHEPQPAISQKKVIRVIRNVGEADQALSEIAEAQRRVAELKADYGRRITALQKEAADACQPHLDRIEGLTDVLFVFANTNREALAEPGTKTIELQAGVMQWRMTPPAIDLRGTTIKKVLKALKALKLSRFIRVKEEPNKEAMLEDQTAAKKVPGVKITQHEEFSVKPATGLTEIVHTVKELLKRAA